MRRPATYRPFPPLPPKPTPSFPCLPDGTNRYIGCISVGDCRAQGTPGCLFGRWSTQPYRPFDLLAPLPPLRPGGARP